MAEGLEADLSSAADAERNDGSEEGGEESSSSSSPLGPMEWVKLQVESGVRPEEVLKEIIGDSFQRPAGADDISLWEAVLELIFRPPSRQPLDHVTSLTDVVRLIEQSQKILVLSGAGISVSCGIPDFRSPEGLYAQLSVRFPDLPDPQAMFDIHFFQLDPRPFFSFAKEILPGNYQPSPCHKFIRALEKRGKLLRNYTQNIDTLEEAAGIERVVYCHGSFSTATCRVCKYRVSIAAIKKDINEESIPYCSRCLETREKRQVDPENPEEEEEEDVGIMKPDVVFFGEGLPESFHKQLQTDKMEADLLIVMGSSLKVRPVSLIPEVIPSDVPQILINREPLQYIRGFDVRLLGYGDAIITEVCRQLGPEWVESIGVINPGEAEVKSPYKRIHLFEGALWDTPPSSENTETSNSSESKLKRSHSADSADSIPEPSIKVSKFNRTNSDDDT